MADSGQILEYQRARAANSRARNCAWILLLVFGSVAMTFGAIVAAWAVLSFFRGASYGVDVVAGTYLGGFPLLFGGMEIKSALDIRKRVATGTDGAMALVLLQGFLVMTLLVLLISGGVSVILVASCLSILLVIVVQIVLLFMVQREDKAFADAAHAIHGAIGAVPMNIDVTKQGDTP